MTIAYNKPRRQILPADLDRRISEVGRKTVPWAGRRIAGRPVREDGVPVAGWSTVSIPTADRHMEWPAERTCEAREARSRKDGTMKLAVRVVISERGGFVAMCPSLPGCTSCGNTREEARKKLDEAIRGYIAAMSNRVLEDVSTEVVEV